MKRRRRDDNSATVSGHPILFLPPATSRSFSAVIFYIQELGLPFVKIAATEIVSGVSGESEEKLRSVFNRAVVRLYAYFGLLCGNGIRGSVGTPFAFRQHALWRRTHRDRKDHFCDTAGKAVVVIIIVITIIIIIILIIIIIIIVMMIMARSRLPCLSVALTMRPLHRWNRRHHPQERNGVQRHGAENRVPAADVHGRWGVHHRRRYLCASNAIVVICAVRGRATFRHCIYIYPFFLE